MRNICSGEKCCGWNYCSTIICCNNINPPGFSNETVIEYQCKKSRRDGIIIAETPTREVPPHTTQIEPAGYTVHGINLFIDTRDTGKLLLNNGTKVRHNPIWEELPLKCLETGGFS
jgi:hypothetical protein